MKNATMNYKLIIQITSPWVVNKLNYTSKANSVLFVDYTKIVEKILNEFENDKDFDQFRFKLCTACRDFTKIKIYNNWYRIESPEIEITENMLALCLPKRIRAKYFKYDNLYERYLLKRDLNFYYI